MVQLAQQRDIDAVQVKRQVLSADTKTSDALRIVVGIQKKFEQRHDPRHGLPKTDAERGAAFLADPEAYMQQLEGALDRVQDNVGGAHIGKLNESRQLVDAARLLFDEAADLLLGDQRAEAQIRLGLGRRLLAASIDALDEKRQAEKTQLPNADELSRDETMANAAAIVKRLAAQLKERNPGAARELTGLAEALGKVDR
ncbi:MAG TPA: hypothetical protein PLP17_04285 [Oligoflexia bacterium]|nr:hypothetical protein [Oligoflexia bacterium]